MRTKGNLISWLTLTSVLFISISYHAERTEAARILSISFMSSKSHRITYDPLLRELARRGHEVTILSPIKAKDEKNFKNILTIHDEEALRNNPSFFPEKPSLVASIFKPFKSPFVWLAPLLCDLCERGFNLPEVQKVFNEKYDLVFFTPLFNECLYGLLHKLNTTTIMFQQVNVQPWMAGLVGTPTPPSFVPIMFVGYSDDMTFQERFINFLVSAYNWAILNFRYYPKMEEIYRRVLKDPSIPSISDIAKNTSLVFSSNHISFGKPRPLLPDIIEVGGLHLSPAQPLPPDLEEFASGAKDGFIFFSMGSFLNSSTMPEKHRKMFVNVFGKLKQRVLWKWEVDMPDISSNVLVRNWLPQQDILGHQNIRIFITHGGLGSTTEAIYHGVPLIGIPCFADQPQNLQRVAKLGSALPPLVYSELTEDILLGAINEILQNPSYHTIARERATVFKDQIDKPLDRAVFWVEYVLRHQGALHLRSAARGLNFIQYFSLDVIFTILVVSFLSIKLQVLLVKAILRPCFPSSSPTKGPSKATKGKKYD